MKIKTDFKNDIRVFKSESNEVEEIFPALEKFITSSYKLSSFTMQYLDEENDCVTIVSSADLKDAIDFAEAMEHQLKIFVREVNKPANPIVSNLDSKQVIDDNTNKENNVENKGNKNSLIEEIINNEKFREEFILFACTFLDLLREDVAHDILQAFIQALSAYELVQKHPQIVKFSKILPFIAPRIQPYSFFLVALDSNTVPQLIDQFVTAEKNNETGSLPPWMHTLRGYLSSIEQNLMGPPRHPPFGFHPPPHPHHPRPHHPHPHHNHPHPHHQHPRGFHHPPPHHPPPDDFQSQEFPYPPPDSSQDDFHPPHGVHHPPPPHDHQFPYPPNPFFGFPHEFVSQFGHGNSENPTPEDLDVSVLSEEESIVLLPSQCVIKTWRIKNTGKIDWPEGVTISYVGDPFNLIVNGVSFPAQSLKVGEEGDISIPVEAPLQPGRYESSWQLMNPNKKLFGPKLLVIICVVDENNEGQIHPTEQKDDEEMRKLLSERENIKGQLEKVETQLNDEKILAESHISNKEINQVENDHTIDNINDIHPVSNNEDQLYQKELESLLAMGFSDEKFLRSLLKQYDGNVDTIMEILR